MKYEASQSVLIREMGSTDLLDYALKLNPAHKDYQKYMKKCIVCYKQLTGKNLLIEINKLNNAI
jgi:hypothetical protein